MGSRNDLPAVPGKPRFKRSEDGNKDEEGELEVQWNPPDYEKSASVLKRSKHTTDQFKSLDFMPELTIVSKLLCILDA